MVMKFWVPQNVVAAQLAAFKEELSSIELATHVAGLVYL
jgi:hypothetical protein